MRKLAKKQAPSDPRQLWVTDKFTGSGTYDDPIDVDAGSGGGGGGGGNCDCGSPTSIYGGAIVVDGGGP